MPVPKSLLVAILLEATISAGLPTGVWPPLVYPMAKTVLSLYPPEYIYNGVFSTDVVIGSQSIRTVLDTGSSNIYVLTTTTNCTELGTLQPAPLADCGYAGPRYVVDDTFTLIPDMNFNNSYGFGGETYGPVGYSQFELGGLVVPQQEWSPVAYASFAGYPQGNVSGNLGLAFESRTRTYPGTDPLKDVVCNATTGSQDCGPVFYSPLLTTMFNLGLTEPIFAFALSRSRSNGGVMTIGGIPELTDPKVNVTSGPTATAALEPYGNETVLSWYVITVDGWAYANASSDAGYGQYLIDSGTGPNVLPPAQAEAFNALFDPPALLNQTTGIYQVACDAQAPELGVSIGGQVFYHNKNDLVMSPSAGTDYCLSAVQGGEMLFLGATFMKSVLAVFDVGGTAMTFASRPFYDDS